MNDTIKINESFSLIEIVRGGPFSAWGARLNYEGQTIHILRSWEGKCALVKSATDFSRFAHPLIRELGLDHFRKWSRDFGSMSKAAGGDEVYH